jgi:hypothetical protein
VCQAAGDLGRIPYTENIALLSCSSLLLLPFLRYSPTHHFDLSWVTPGVGTHPSRTRYIDLMRLVNFCRVDVMLQTHSSHAAEGRSPPPVRCSDVQNTVTPGILQLQTESCSSTRSLAVTLGPSHAHPKSSEVELTRKLYSHSWTWLSP